MQSAEGGTFRLGPRLLQLAAKTWDDSDLRTIARDFLVSLRDATDEAVHLAVPSNNRMVYIDKLVGSSTVQMKTSIGGQVELHSTSVGKAWLSGLSDQRLMELIRSLDLRRHTAKTFTTPETLFEELKRTREQGFAFDDEENEPDIRCLGSPIFNRAGGADRRGQHQHARLSARRGAPRTLLEACPSDGEADQHRVVQDGVARVRGGSVWRDPPWMKLPGGTEDGIVSPHRSVGCSLRSRSSVGRSRRRRAPGTRSACSWHGTLAIAIEANDVRMELVAPGMDIVGFEHEADTARQKKAIEAALADLKEPLRLFMLPEPTGCAVTSAEVALVAEAHDDHQAGHPGRTAETDEDDEDHEGRHSEFRATYALACKDASLIRFIHFAFLIGSGMPRNLR